MTETSRIDAAHRPQRVGGVRPRPADARRRPGPTAFVFAGGAALGSVQVGMLRTLMDAGMRPDLVTGTSSGAMNGAMLAADPGARAIHRLEYVWTTMRRSEILPLRPLSVLRGLTGRADHLASSAGIRRVVERYLPITRLEEARAPLYVVAADTATREKVVLTSGHAGTALTASAAIPGLYPPIEIDGRLLVDGGLAEDPPIGTAVEAGASTVYVLPVGWPPGPAPRRGARDRAMDALDWLFWRVASSQLDRWASECDLYVLPSPPITGLFPMSNGSARRMIADAERLARAWLPTARPWPEGPVRTWLDVAHAGAAEPALAIGS